MAKRICSVESCERPAAEWGYCPAHLSRWRRNGDVQAAVPIRGPGLTKCKVEGCPEPSVARGWCRRHYRAWNERGHDPDTWVPQITPQVFTDTHKLCPDCGETKPLECFSPNTKTRSGRATNCHFCHSKRMLEWKRTKRTPAQYERALLRYRRRNLREKYGITIEEYDARLRAQSGKCLACGTDDPGARNFHVDHDHSNGSIRGLLCHNCNTAIGLAGDDPERLEALARYLRR